eukprot:gene642-237_t
MVVDVENQEFTSPLKRCGRSYNLLEDAGGKKRRRSFKQKPLTRLEIIGCLFVPVCLMFFMFSVCMGILYVTFFRSYSSVETAHHDYLSLLIHGSKQDPDLIEKCIVGWSQFKLFPSTQCLSSWSLVVLLLTYGFILTVASCCVSDGSELLLLVPRLGDFVGSIVLPILGAVPDAILILFSGLGSDANEQIDVGVGVLAGSTTMLLTLPWFISIWAGKVDCDPHTGEPVYRPPKNAPVDWKKSGSQPLWNQGVAYEKAILLNAYIMMGTSILYIIPLIPAEVNRPGTPEQLRGYVIATIVLCVFCGLGYLVVQVWHNQSESRKLKLLWARVEAVRRGDVSLRGVSIYMLENHLPDRDDERHNHPDFPDFLTDLDEVGQIEFEELLWPFFKRYDWDRSNTIDEDELVLLLADFQEILPMNVHVKNTDFGQNRRRTRSAIFGMKDKGRINLKDIYNASLGPDSHRRLKSQASLSKMMSSEQLNKLSAPDLMLQHYDSDGDGAINFTEFCQMMLKYCWKYRGSAPKGDSAAQQKADPKMAHRSSVRSAGSTTKIQIGRLSDRKSKSPRTVAEVYGGIDEKYIKEMERKREERDKAVKIGASEPIAEGDETEGEESSLPDDSGGDSSPEPPSLEGHVQEDDYLDNENVPLIHVEEPLDPAAFLPSSMRQKRRELTKEVPLGQASKTKIDPEIDILVEEEEEEEIPSDLADLSPAQQQWRIRWRACWMITLGVFLIVVFSDPLVDILSEIGTRLGINAFYVSFILAPFASNSSELVAAASYAAKKTSKTITISASALEGAVIMNNTLAFGVFMVIVLAKSLNWKHTAEIIAIIFAEVCIGLIAMKRIHKWLTATAIMLIYPLTILLVWILKGPLWTFPLINHFNSCVSPNMTARVNSTAAAEEILNSVRKSAFGPNMNRRSLNSRPPTRSCRPWNSATNKDRDFDPKYKSNGHYEKNQKKLRPWTHGPWKPGGLGYDCIEGFVGIGRPEDPEPENMYKKKRRQDFRAAVPMRKIFSHSDLLVSSEYQINLEEYIAEGRHLAEYHEFLGKKKRAMVQKKIMPPGPHHSTWNPGLPVDQDFQPRSEVRPIEWEESNLRWARKMKNNREERVAYRKDIQELLESEQSSKSDTEVVSVPSAAEAAQMSKEPSVVQDATPKQPTPRQPTPRKETKPVSRPTSAPLVARVAKGISHPSVPERPRLALQKVKREAAPQQSARSGGSSQQAAKRHSKCWQPRFGSACCLIPGKEGQFDSIPDTILMTGGATSGGVDNSVWSSTDRGATWQCVCQVAQFRPRCRHGLVYLPVANRLVLFGGYGGDGVYFQDVWMSDNNGASWMLLSDKRTKWMARAGMAYVVQEDDTIVIMGGDGMAFGSDEEVFNDVWEWRPGHGPDWDLITPNAGWEPRTGATAIVGKNDSIVLSGGFRENEALSDVWVSKDGKKWKQLNKLQAPLAAAHPAKLGSDMFMFGGRSDNPPNCLDEIWCSKDDGKTWKVLERGVEGFTARCWAMVVVSPPMSETNARNKSEDGEITYPDDWDKPLFLLFGGIDDDGVCHSDVWSSVDGRVWKNLQPDAAPSPRKELIAKLQLPKI